MRRGPGVLCVVLAGVMTDAERRDLNEALEQPEFRELVARASGDLHETRAFMAGLRDHFGRWLAQLWAVEREALATYGDASERYSDAGFHQFAALRMGIHSIGAKVTWCNETLAAIDRRLASRRGAGAAAHGGPRDHREHSS